METGDFMRGVCSFWQTVQLLILGCGLACQIGYSVGLPSIGVAKNFGGSGLRQFKLDDKTIDQLENVTLLGCQST